MTGNYHKHLIRFLYDNYRSLESHCDPDEPDPDVVEVLKTLDFDEGQEQDYGNPRVQELYALRYTYSYAYEYREMFLRFANGEEVPNYWDILSIGCGTGIDYWAAREALTLAELPIGVRVRYTGIDLIEWKGRWGRKYLSQNADVHYETGDAAAYLQNHPVLSQNIYVFPKSISEFPEDVFEEICDAFATAEFQRVGPVHFMVSLRTNGQTDPDELLDKERSDQLIEAMEENGYVLKNGAEIVTEAAEDIKISDAEEGFKFPEDIRRYVEELYKAGISRKRTIRSMKFICNRIMSFERKERL